MRSSRSPARPAPSARSPRRLAGYGAYGLGLALLACGARTPLEAEGAPAESASLPPGAGDDAAPDAAAQDDAPASDVVEATAPPPDPCSRMPPVPCPGGGYQYCVAGHYSECPNRCGFCNPGSTRVCFLTYCRRWGTQTCAADGLSFGFCAERAPPSQCAAIADQYKSSPELEQCCIDNGYCCEDRFDLDGDGNSGDLIGSCGATSC